MAMGLNDDYSLLWSNIKVPTGVVNPVQLTTTVNLVKLATEKTQNLYYTVITSDLNQRISPLCGYQCSSPCCKFY